MSEFQSGTGPTEAGIGQIRERIKWRYTDEFDPFDSTVTDVGTLLAAYDVMKQQRDEARARVKDLEWELEHLCRDQSCPIGTGIPHVHDEASTIVRDDDSVTVTISVDGWSEGS